MKAFYVKIIRKYFIVKLIIKETERGKVWLQFGAVRQPLSGLPRVTPGYSIGQISVRQPEPG